MSCVQAASLRSTIVALHNRAGQKHARTHRLHYRSVGTLHQRRHQEMLEPPREVMPKAREEALKAIQIDGSAGVVLAALALALPSTRRIVPTYLRFVGMHAYKANSPMSDPTGSGHRRCGETLR